MIFIKLFLLITDGKRWWWLQLDSGKCQAKTSCDGKANDWVNQTASADGEWERWLRFQLDYTKKTGTRGQIDFENSKIEKYRKDITAKKHQRPSSLENWKWYNKELIAPSNQLNNTELW